jgi:TolB-like protein/cytochrome c-type biogenesis protein CcmH/NrfG
LALDPEFAAHARSKVGTWHFASGLMDSILEGLRKAGLPIPATDDSSDSSRRIGPVTAKADRAKSSTDAKAIRAEEGFWIAVLPFKYSGGNADLTALAEGLTEEIVTGLSRFSYLRVIARGSTSRYANESVDVRSAGKQLSARYVMEGSLRQAGTRLRIAVQLVDTSSGAHLWAETYDRPFQSEAVFELQDELVPRIVSTVADMHGVLPRSMSEVVRLKAADQMSPYEALLRSFGYNERFTPEDLAEVRTCLERAVQQAPGNAECWAMLSLTYANEYGHWDNAGPDSLDRSLRAARTAVEAAPLHSLPYYALAQALFFKREIPAFRVAAERAISLNPMDGATAAFMGMLIAYAGDWERGCALSDKGQQLNPNHPGWYRYPAWHDAYRKKDYRKALDVALRLNAPKNYYTHAVLAICCAQLGRMEEARKALRDMLALKPNYAQVARELHGRWIEPDLVEQLMDGLRKAGLDIGDKAGASAAVKASDSGAVRAEEGFWVAVLPFKYSGSNAELTALAEGLTEDIVTGLSRFSYLRVIARGSTAKYSSESEDIRAIGKELGARYVMEGSLRQAGTKLRLAVQLVDAVSGAHLWAENYERNFSPEAVFELQDELVPRIVSTVADMNGVLPRSMSEVVRSRTPEELSPYEAVLRSFGYFERVTAEELAAARSGLESAVRKAPAYGDAWAMLALLCVQEHAQGFNLQANCLTSGATAARRAVEAAPSNHLGYFSLAQALFFQKEFQSFRNAAERAVALNPMDGNSIAFLGELLTYAGDGERGMALAERAKQLNPNHPGWYWYADFYNAYREGDYRGALNFVLKSNLPGHWGMQAAMAATYGQLGEPAAAGKALRELLKLRPDFAATIGKDVEKWWEPEYGEQFIDGLCKAGLEIAGGK